MGAHKVERTRDIHRAVGRQVLADDCINSLEQRRFDRMVATGMVRQERGPRPPRGAASLYDSPVPHISQFPAL